MKIEISINFVCALISNEYRLFQVPRVFVNGKYIGGGTDVKKLNETGQLKPLL